MLIYLWAFGALVASVGVERRNTDVAPGIVRDAGLQRTTLSHRGG